MQTTIKLIILFIMFFVASCSVTISRTGEVITYSGKVMFIKITIFFLLGSIIAFN